MVDEVSGEERQKDTIHYKVVELSTVDDESIEQALNEWTPRGYVLDGIHFAMKESSRRPAMAFVVFVTRRPAEEV